MRIAERSQDCPDILEAELDPEPLEPFKIGPALAGSH